MIANSITLYGLSGYEKSIDYIIKELSLEEIAFDIRLILTEAITNAYYHGNKSMASEPIGLSYEYDGSLFNIKIKDSGSEDIRLHIPEEINDDDILNTEGRGLFLIKSLADKVEYLNNTLIIYKKIN